MLELIIGRELNLRVEFASYNDESWLKIFMTSVIADQLHDTSIQFTSFVFANKAINTLEIYNLPGHRYVILWLSSDFTRMNDYSNNTPRRCSTNTCTNTT